MREGPEKNKTNQMCVWQGVDVQMHNNDKCRDFLSIKSEFFFSFTEKSRFLLICHDNRGHTSAPIVPNKNISY